MCTSVKSSLSIAAIYGLPDISQFLRSLSVMAPPQKDVDPKGYKTYLEKQRKRRAKERAKRRQARLEQQADRIVKARMRSLAARIKQLIQHRLKIKDGEVAAAISKKNTYMRKAGFAAMKEEHLLRVYQEVLHEHERVKDTLAWTRAQLKEQKVAVSDLKSKLKPALQTLYAWERWWHRAKMDDQARLPCNVDT